MPSIFETASVSNAIPITFVTKTNWEQIRETLPAHARQFAQANGFAADAAAPDLRDLAFSRR